MMKNTKHTKLQFLVVFLCSFFCLLNARIVTGQEPHDEITPPIASEVSVSTDDNQISLELKEGCSTLNIINALSSCTRQEFLRTGHEMNDEKLSACVEQKTGVHSASLLGGAGILFNPLIKRFRESFYGICPLIADDQMACDQKESQKSCIQERILASQCVMTNVAFFMQKYCMGTPSSEDINKLYETPQETAKLVEMQQSSQIHISKTEDGSGYKYDLDTFSIDQVTVKSGLHRLNSKSFDKVPDVETLNSVCMIHEAVKTYHQESDFWNRASHVRFNVKKDQVIMTYPPQGPKTQSVSVTIPTEVVCQDESETCERVKNFSLISKFPNPPDPLNPKEDFAFFANSALGETIDPNSPEGDFDRFLQMTCETVETNPNQMACVIFSTITHLEFETIGSSFK